MITAMDTGIYSTSSEAEKGRPWNQGHSGLYHKKNLKNVFYKHTK